jgi:general secretion pathway protein M
MTFWADRTPRERVMLLGLGVVALVWLGVAGIWQPLQAQRAALTAQIARYQTAVQMVANPVQAVRSDTRAIPVIITDSAATFQLTIRRLQPTGDLVQIVLEDAPFEGVLLWIEALTTNHALQLQSLDLIRRPAPGVVAATLTVAR